MLKEIGDLAGQREVVAESLQSAVFNAITLLSKTLRDDRKKALSDGTTLTQNLTAQIGGLDRAKRAYEKAYRDSEKALDNYQRADADLNLSRAEVEKQRNNMTMKSQQSEDAKNEYANQLQKTNKLQQSHYEISLPDVSVCAVCGVCDSVMRGVVAARQPLSYVASARARFSLARRSHD